MPEWQKDSNLSASVWMRKLSWLLSFFKEEKLNCYTCYCNKKYRPATLCWAKKKRHPEKACFVTDDVLITFTCHHLYINYKVNLLPGHHFILSCSTCAVDCKKVHQERYKQYRDFFQKQSLFTLTTWLFFLKMNVQSVSVCSPTLEFNFFFERTLERQSLSKDLLWEVQERRTSLLHTVG